MRIKKNYDIYFKGEHLTGIWASGKDILISFGLKTHIKNRNIHLSIFFSNKDKTLNTHITDTGKNPKKVWEKTAHIDELIPIIQKFVRDSFKRYYWFNYYWICSDELVDSLGFSFKDKDYFKNKIDIANIFKSTLKKDALTKTRIIKGYSNYKFRLGFQFKFNNDYLIIPLSNKFMIKINADITKTPLIKLPTIEGLYKYFEYLEREHIFEQMKEFSEMNIQKMKNVLIGPLL